MRFAIFTSGHSGSSWLASALDQRRHGVGVFHEPVGEIAPDVIEQAFAFRVPPASQLTADLRRYADWVRHRERQFEVFGEIHTGVWSFWGAVAHLLPSSRYLLLRNPIQVVHSLSRSFICQGTPSEKVWALGLSPPQFSDLSAEQQIFAGACQVWSQQQQLLERLGVQEVFRLEDLLCGEDALPAAYARITGKSYDRSALREVRARDVKRKIPGDNGPANLFWNLWSDWMREAFLAACGQGMERFGYRLPDPAEAPSPPDLRPLHPQPAPALPMGALTTLWVFSFNPQLSPILVCGRPRYAALAARLLGPGRARLLRDDGWTEEDAPPEIAVLTAQQAAACQPAGVFVADPEVSEQRLAQLAARFPLAELVTMLPAELSDDQLHAIDEHLGPARPPPPRPPDAMGPLRCGEVAGGWKIVRLKNLATCWEIAIASDGDLRAELELRPDDAAGRNIPFPVAEGGLFYRPVSFPFSHMEPACRALADRLRRALRGRSLRQALKDWEREADAASSKRGA